MAKTLVNQTKSHQRIPEIDGLRGIAAIGVCLFHFSMYFPANHFYSFTNLKYGATGVDLFFMISGFVIFMSVNSVKTQRDFWFGRLNRIFPTYWLSIILTLLFYYLFNSFDFKKLEDFKYVAGNILMLQPLFKRGELVGAYWTLYVELLFYGFISLVWFLKLLPKIETLIWTGLIIMLLINVPYVLLMDKSSGFTRFFIVARSMAPLITCFNYFAAGIIFYKIYHDGITVNRVVILCSCYLLVIPVSISGGHFSQYFDVYERLACVAVFYSLFIAILIKRASLLKTSIFVFLGAISYALYLIHDSVGITLIGVFTPRFGATGATIIALALSLSGAALISFYFEKPVHSWLKTQFKKRFSPRRSQTASNIMAES